MTMTATMREAWESYAEGTEVDSFAEFCERYIVLFEDRWDGQPLMLEDFQRRVFGEALATDDDDRRIWESVIWVMPRKNAKTATLAAYAVFRLFDPGSPEILLTASSDRQAGKLYGFCANFVRRSPALSQMLRVRDHEGEIIREDGMGKILRMSSDPRRLHGYGPSLVVADELAQWTTPQLERAYAALTSGGGARSRPQVFTITTAGEAHERHDSILGRLLDGALVKGEVEREPGLTIARDFAGKRLVWIYEAPTTDPHDTEALKLANPASWISEEFLRKQADNDELTDSQTLQLHGCVWAERTDAWLPAGSWEPLEEARAVAGERVVLGFDGSYRNDSTALVGCTVEEKPHLFVAGVWEKPEHAKDWIVPREAVSAAVDQAMRDYDVAMLVCDPPGWHREIEEWGERYGHTVTLMFPTNRRKLMAEACSKFYTAVVNGDLSHDGNLDLARHLANAVTKDTPDGAYITKDHPASMRKIDLAVAAVVAHDQAHEQTGEGWFY